MTRHCDRQLGSLIRSLQHCCNPATYRPRVPPSGMAVARIRLRVYHDNPLRSRCAFLVQEDQTVRPSMMDVVGWLLAVDYSAEPAVSLSKEPAAA